MLFMTVNTVQASHNNDCSHHHLGIVSVDSRHNEKCTHRVAEKQAVWEVISVISLL